MPKYAHYSMPSGEMEYLPIEELSKRKSNFMWWYLLALFIFCIGATFVNLFLIQ